jgi:DNA polymerase III sliding clamp (beta) subunit (PCNA family)
MVKVSTKQFKKAVRQSLVSKIQDAVLLKVSNGILQVCSTDRDSYLSVNVEVIQEGDDFTALVDRLSLLKILKTIKTDYTSLELQQGYLIINTDNYLKTKYLTLFKPYGLDKDISDGVVLNSQTIANTIDKVIDFVIKTKYDIEWYQNVIFSFEHNTLFVTGVNSDFQTACNLKVANNLNLMIGIPKPAALQLKKILNSTRDKDILFNVIDNSDYREYVFKYDKVAVFKSNNFVFTTRVADIDMRDITSTINDGREDLTIIIGLLKKKIIHALKTLVGETKRKDYPIKAYPIRLTLTNNNLNILSLLDKRDVDIPVDYTGDMFETDTDAFYLLNALENICTDVVIFRFPPEKVWDRKWLIEPEEKSRCDCISIFSCFKYREKLLAYIMTQKALKKASQKV